MRLKNSKWTMVMVAVIAFLMVGTMVWASPPAGAPSGPVTAGLNAHTVDGLHASKRPKANTLLALNKNNKFPNGVIPGAIARDKEVMRILKKNDGAGSGLDADLLDGQDGSYYLVPSGAVMFFNLESCPSGWHELTEARGRYLVGLTDRGTLAGTVGTALSDLENRAVGKHTHDITDAGHSHGVTDPGHSHNVHWLPLGGTRLGDEDGDRFLRFYNIHTGNAQIGISINDHTTDITIMDAGSVDGTNAPYIQFLVCVKD